MGKLVISENITLDGVIADPTGDDGTRFGGWFNQIGDRDREAWAKAELNEALGAEALLMGRRSDEYFAPRWAGRTGEWAERLDRLPKYVVSATIDEAKWTNATVLKGDVVTEVSKLKQEISGEIVVNASGQLVPTLLEHDLADELRLIIYPIVVGAGPRPFGEISDSKAMRLVRAQTLGDTLVHLIYERVAAA